MKTQQGNARVGFFIKYVVILLVKGIQYAPGTIHIQVVFLQVIVRPYIIQTSCVIPVFMGEQQCIDSVYPCPNHLIPKIRTGIDNDTDSANFNMHTAPKSLVFGIVTQANFRSATYGRHSL
jgi:hypothetical protein